MILAQGEAPETMRMSVADHTFVAREFTRRIVADATHEFQQPQNRHNFGSPEKVRTKLASFRNSSFVQIQSGMDLRRGLSRFPSCHVVWSATDILIVSGASP